MAEIYRQGDVILKRIEVMPEVDDEKKLSHLTLAEGEVTGHRHRITQGEAQLYQLAVGVMYLRILSEFARLYHEEHEHIDLPKGDYQVLIEREYDWVEGLEKKVVD
mgnify:FL=1